METEKTGQMEAEAQTKFWAMFRECARLLEENTTRWMERQENEEIRKLEEEKDQRLEDGKMKRDKLLEKLKKRRETKPEKLRRLEDERMKAGRLKMRSSRTFPYQTFPYQHNIWLCLNLFNRTCFHFTQIE